MLDTLVYCRANSSADSAQSEVQTNWAQINPNVRGIDCRHYMQYPIEVKNGYAIHRMRQEGM